MRVATLLALMGVSRPIYHLIILNEAILIVLSNHINIMLLPASHVTYTVYNFTDLINNSVCLSVCLRSSGLFRPMYRSMCWHVQLHAHASPVPYSCKETSHSASDSLIDVLTCLD